MAYILIGMETSNTTAKEFRKLGHKVISCDLLDNDEDNTNHYKGDVFDIINDGFNFALFHPTCTYLTVSANKWLKDQPKRKSGALVGPERRQAVEDAVTLFMKLVNCNIPHTAIENPIGIMSTRYRKPDQVLQPWMFGHGETKATCLWLKNLPKLTPTNIVEGREQRLHNLSPSKDRWKIRSKTYSGISEAMATQWHSILTN